MVAPDVTVGQKVVYHQPCTNRQKNLSWGIGEWGTKGRGGTEEMAEEFADDDCGHGCYVKQSSGKIGEAVAHWCGGIKEQHQRLIY